MSEIIIGPKKKEEEEEEIPDSNDVVAVAVTLSF